MTCRSLLVPQLHLISFKKQYSDSLTFSPSFLLMSPNVFKLCISCETTTSNNKVKNKNIRHNTRIRSQLTSSRNDVNAI